MRLALDATYSLGPNLSGVGIYSREIIAGLSAAHPDAEFLLCYRPHRFIRALGEHWPANCRTRLLYEPLAPAAALFHSLNQRLPRVRLRRAVATFHDLFVLTSEYSSPEFRARFEAQARDAASRADLIIAVSEFTAGQVETLLGVERARLRVVHHGVRMPAANKPAPPRERLVLHVGAIQKRKNIDRLVEAFERMPAGWKLVLAGSAGFGAEEILARIAASPRRADIDPRGYATGAELAKLYARASIFAFPSLDEGFGMPVLEAMAHGTPVITSNRSALPEVAGDAAVLVDPADREALAATLMDLAENDGLREELSLRGKRRAASFTWEAAFSKTWSTYNELLARKG